MRNRFERQLLELNNELIQMGSMIEHAIEMGISALVRQDVDILCCSDCGKLEFFRGEWSELEDPEGSGIARMECPSCGRSYELDSPKCPFCGKKNTRLF